MRSLAITLVVSCAIVLGTPVAVNGQTVCRSPWELEETLRIGSFDGPDAISGVADFEIGPDGRIYIVEPITPYVTVFDARGRRAGMIGRAGGGPGEFTTGAGGLWWRSDTLWVTSYPRTNLYTRDGKLAGELSFRTPILSGDSSAFIAGQPLADGSVLGRRVVWGRPYEVATVLPLRRFTRSGAVIDTIAMVRRQVPRMVDVPELGLSLNPFAHQGEVRNPPVAVTADGSAVILIGEVRTERPAPTLRNLGGLLGGPTGSFELLRIGINGDTLLKALIPFDPEPLSAARRQWFEDVFAAYKAGDYMSSSGNSINPKPSAQEAERRRALARGQLPIPDYLPPVRDIVSGKDGTIWLLREFREDRADLWEVYSASGRLEGSFLISDGHLSSIPWLPRMRMLHATRGEVWAFTMAGDLDIPVIRRYRVQRTCR